jgi:hypothetical protein
VDCPDFVPAEGREVLPRCRISVTGQGQLALFCRNCQVQEIRAQPHCRHLRFQSRMRVGLLGQPGVQAVLTCSLTDRGTRLARCRRCLSYQE